MRTVSLTTAKAAFSKLVEEVESGAGFVIARHGRAIAKLVPHAPDKATDPAWTAAYRRMTARLEEGASLGSFKVERDVFRDR